MSKNGLYILIIIFLMIFSIKKDVVAQGNQFDNDSAEYEIIIMENGFDSWFATNRKPRWYFSHNYYLYHNNLMTREWNYRATQKYAGEPYDQPINYELSVDYGFEVDYMLYWYLKFVEDKYNIKLDLTTFR